MHIKIFYQLNRNIIVYPHTISLGKHCNIYYWCSNKGFPPQSGVYGLLNELSNNRGEITQIYELSNNEGGFTQIKELSIKRGGFEQIYT